MLDGLARRIIVPPLDRIGRRLAARGIGADAVTWTGFALGAAAAGAIAGRFYLVGLVLILANRLLDGLDGAVARASGKTDRGGFLDIVLDFAFYGLIPLAFVVADPAANGLAGATLLFTFYANGASFLAYAVMAEKRGLASELRGAKSLYFTTGLAEATETVIAFALFCLMPSAFVPIACLFAAMTAVTAIARIALALKTFA